jgi:hypothetical protein
MDPVSSLSQAAPSRRGRRRRSSNISIPQIGSNTYQENRCICRARMNVASNPKALGATHETATASTH